jgi:hypothetical protein
VLSKKTNARESRKTPNWTSNFFVATLQFKKQIKHEDGEKQVEKK